MSYSKYPREFWANVDVSGECWLWKGSRFENGYGRWHEANKGKRAHKVSWEKTHGIVPQGMMVCHKCDVPLCVRPSHLFLGTAKDNQIDASQKGRLPGRRNWKQCIRGHRLSADNLYWFKSNRPDGPKRRQCRRCTLERQQRANMEVRDYE